MSNFSFHLTFNFQFKCRLRNKVKQLECHVLKGIAKKHLLETDEKFYGITITFTAFKIDIYICHF